MFRYGNVVSAPAVTLSKGISQYGSVVWSVVADELRTPHEGILIQIGEKEKSVRHDFIDWKHFDWDGYKAASRVELAELKEKWNQDVELDCDGMLQSLTDSIQRCVDKSCSNENYYISQQALGQQRSIRTA